MEYRDEVLTNWRATFTDLRLANITLQEWLEYHRMYKNI